MEINETYARIGEYIRSHESETYSQIAVTLGLSRAAVARIARLQGIKRRAGRRPSLEVAVAAIEAAPASDEANSAGPDAAPLDAAVQQ
jgi:hypothetical protein